jgi:hypothetical protein
MNIFNFEIYAENFYWLCSDDKDNPDDLCLHGDMIAVIGDEKLEYNGCVSAAGLYFLRTLTENHIINSDQPIFPCCGHHLYAVNEELDTVDIGGCPNGVDFSVIHESDNVKITTKSGNEICVNFNEYENKINAFADSVESYYEKCLPKYLSKCDTIERNGYIAFWNEWKRR